MKYYLSKGRRSVRKSKRKQNSIRRKSNYRNSNRYRRRSSRRRNSRKRSNRRRSSHKRSSRRRNYTRSKSTFGETPFSYFPNFQYPSENKETIQSLEERSRTPYSNVNNATPTPTPTPTATPASSGPLDFVAGLLGISQPSAPPTLPTPSSQELTVYSSPYVPLSERDRSPYSSGPSYSSPGLLGSPPTAPMEAPTPLLSFSDQCPTSDEFDNICMGLYGDSNYVEAMQLAQQRRLGRELTSQEKSKIRKALLKVHPDKINADHPLAKYKQCSDYDHCAKMLNA